jgi:HAMP domain-containing protein
MKIPIFIKLLTATLLLVVTPLFVANYLSIQDLDSLGNTAMSNSTKSLDDLAGKIIIQKARDVAKQVEIYVKAHPGVTFKQLQEDPYFKDIAWQQVGTTPKDKGYTCLYVAETAIMLIHPNSTLINYDMKGLREKLPSWWTIFGPSLTGKESTGPYDWLEKDGSITKKYMTMTPVSIKVEGKTLMIAATTYINEFSKPSVDTQESIKIAVATTKTRALTIFTTIALLSMLVVYFLSKAITVPLKKLKLAGEEIAKGNLDMDVSAGKSHDEIGDLAVSFEEMVIKLREAREETEHAHDMAKKARTGA